MQSRLSLIKYKNPKDKLIMQGTRRFSTKILRTLTTKPRDSFKNMELMKAGRFQLPDKMPSFSRVTSLNNHCFSVGADQYEYIGGQYYKRIAKLSVGQSFGHVALQRQCKQESTIKTEGMCEFAYLEKNNYNSTLLEIRNKHETNVVRFLRTQPVFKPLT